MLSLNLWSTFIESVNASLTDCNVSSCNMKDSCVYNINFNLIIMWVAKHTEWIILFGIK